MRRLATVEALLESIETENQSFSEFRAKRSRTFSALKSAMVPIQLVVDLASAGAQIATALRGLGFLDECIKYFQSAIELGSASECLIARAGMAAAYVSMEGYNKAIEVQEACMRQLGTDEHPFPNNSHKNNLQIHRVLECLGLCYTMLGDCEKGLSLYRKALGYNNPCSTCIRSILAYLNTQE